MAHEPGDPEETEEPPVALKAIVSEQAENGDWTNEEALKNRLAGLALLAALAVMPFSQALFRQVNSKTPPSAIWIQVGFNAGFTFLITLGFIALGFRARRSLRLPPVLLHDWPPVEEASRRRAKKSLILAFGLGAGLGVVLIGLGYLVEPYMPQPEQEIHSPDAFRGLLASIGAGIQEELWLRWGLLTALVWLGTRLTRQKVASDGFFWVGNILAALIFGAIHIPQGVALLGFSWAMVASALIGNAVPGMVFGWLYWRYGILAAMVSHFAIDLVLKAAAPLLGID